MRGINGANCVNVHYLWSALECDGKYPVEYSRSGGYRETMLRSEAASVSFAWKPQDLVVLGRGTFDLSNHNRRR